MRRREIKYRRRAVRKKGHEGGHQKEGFRRLPRIKSNKFDFESNFPGPPISDVHRNDAHYWRHRSGREKGRRSLLAFSLRFRLILRTRTPLSAVLASGVSTIHARFRFCFAVDGRAFEWDTISRCSRHSCPRIIKCSSGCREFRGCHRCLTTTLIALTAIRFLLLFQVRGTERSDVIRAQHFRPAVSHGLSRPRCVIRKRIISDGARNGRSGRVETNFTDLFCERVENARGRS